MFSKIELSNFGPHKNTVLELDSKGTTVIRGRSESGKSTLVEAICFVLWGSGTNGRPLPIERLAATATVKLTTRSGNVLTRTMTPGRVTTRTFQKAGGFPTEFATEAEWAAELGKIGAKGGVIRLAMVPMSWVPLAMGEGEGRPLRDALMQVLPPADLRAEVARLMREDVFDLAPSDPIDPKTAESNRKAAKATHEQATGAVTTLTAQVEAAAGAEPLPVPSDEHLSAARATLNLADEWARARQAQAIFEAAAGQSAPVSVEPGAVEAVTERYARVRAAHDAESELRELRNALVIAGPHPEQASANLKLSELQKQLDKLNGSDECPTCKRPGWDGAVAERERAAVAAKSAALYAEELRGNHERKSVKLQEARQLRIEALEAIIQNGEGGDLEATHTELVQIQAAQRAYAAYSARALPSAPEIPAEPDPTDNELALARKTIDAHRTNAGIEAERARNLKALRDNLAKAESNAKSSAIEVARMESLVSAVRRAPSVIAERQSSALGDLGPVSIEFNDKGGVNVLIDSRPFYIASTGKQIVADLYFRAGVRRALGFGWLPIFVDNAGSWTGDWPKVEGPVVFLRTEDTDLQSRPL